MRVEGDRASPHFWGLFFKSEPFVRVLLDGTEVKHCRMADDEAGEVEVEEHDEHGNIVVDLQKNEIAIRKLTGRVEIIGELLDHLRPAARVD